MLELIEKTRDGVALNPVDVERLIHGIATDAFPDYQVAAWLMAAYCNGLSDSEVYALTDAVAKSGSQVTEPLGLVDKHSTGGVGDKTTLIVAPLVTSLGIPLAKMSGRGLGHTGGTLDKLESIPGFRVALSREQIAMQVQQIGLAVVAQTEELAPADKKMYALRDVTGTVDSIPLIAISIMSKKLASGAPNLVLDVKVGNGAFMQSVKRARELAKMMVRIGAYHGRHVRALLTRMDQPLGYAVGNAIEINEARQCLQGGGPADLREEVIALASQMVSMGLDISLEDAQVKVENALYQGMAWRKFEKWIEAQGGDVSAIQQDLPLAPTQKEWVATEDATVVSINTQAIGQVALELGAGRHQLQDPVDPGVGLTCFAKSGAILKKGELIATVYARSQAEAQRAIQQLQQAIVMDETGRRDEGLQSVVMELIASDEART
ncbi:thymidine phosphorylase [Alicyclobacillaceae bacterium I2511]|nr:thymidine phosphorylase [Alicyclobacillaceae bacterium I2511]